MVHVVAHQYRSEANLEGINRLKGSWGIENEDSCSFTSRI